MSFDRDIGHYVVKRRILIHKGNVVNQVSISGHTIYWSDLSNDENNQLAKFRKMDSTTQNTKNDVIRLLRNCSYDSSLIYRAVKQN